MALEDIIKNFEGYQTISSLAQSVAQDPTNPESRQGYAQFLTKYLNVDEAQAETVVETLREKPTELREYMGIRQQVIQDELTDLVSQNYKQIIDELPKEELEQLAIGLPDKDKKYLAYAKIIQENDVNGAKKVLSELYEFPEWKLYISRLEPESAAQHLATYIQGKQNKFKKENLCDEVKKKDKDGKEKKEYVFNENKAKKYIIKTLESYKDEEKTMPYLALAQTYYKIKKKKK